MLVGKDFTTTLRNRVAVVFRTVAHMRAHTRAQAHTKTQAFMVSSSACCLRNQRLIFRRSLTQRKSGHGTAARAHTVVLPADTVPRSMPVRATASWRDVKQSRPFTSDDYCKVLAVETHSRIKDITLKPFRCLLSVVVRRVISLLK